MAMKLHAAATALVMPLAVGPLLLAPRALAAQKVSVVSLKPADAKLDEEFTLIGSVRELKDGRVLLNDPRDGRVVVADFRTGKVEKVGRTGQGPGEYSYAPPVRQIAGDSSLLADPLSRRWLLLDGAGVVATIRPDAPAILATGGMVTGTDRNGFVVVVKGPEHRPGTTTYGTGDSMALVRVSRASGHADTIAHLRYAVGARTDVKTDADGKVTQSSLSRPAFATTEESLLAADGWLAIARLDPYRVDWRAPDGRVTLGAPLPVPIVKLDDREKKAYLDRNAKDIADLRARNLTADRRATVERPFTEFPAAIPPFQQGALVTSDDGRVLIRRTLTADHPETRYDVVNRRGILEGQITMGENERILGFGAKSVYVAWKDADDVERLRRHPWPANRPLVP